MNALFNLRLSTFKVLSLPPLKFLQQCIIPPLINYLLNITNCVKKAMHAFCYFSLPVWFGSGGHMFYMIYMVQKRVQNSET